MKTSNYKELIVWQKSMTLVEYIYKTTAIFPKSELHCLVSQMRRSAISIPSNIAEGRHRQTLKDYVHFLCISASSLAELETQLEIASRLRYCPSGHKEVILELTVEISKMLNSMIYKLRKKLKSS